MQPGEMAELQAWIGRRSEAEDVVTERLVEGFRTTLAPHLPPSREDEAPLGIHWCLAPAMTPISELGPDGHPVKGILLPPVPLPRRMWAGGEIEGSPALRIGDRVLRRSVISDVVAKTGRSGPLCFVTVDHEYSTARGPAFRERHDIVYRELPGSAPAAAPVSTTREPPGELSWHVESSPVLLFRYSALTFNGHRIHYDQPYVTGVEGYPGLVVHGPLQATLLLNIAAAMGAPSSFRFRYRGLSALIAGPAFEVCGRTAGGKIEGWTRDAVGTRCMEAETSW
jgi:3-methylfumaryl-CoA hydratase